MYVYVYIYTYGGRVLVQARSLLFPVDPDRILREEDRVGVREHSRAISRPTSWYGSSEKMLISAVDVIIRDKVCVVRDILTP